MSDDELDPSAILANLGAIDATVVAPVSGGWDTAIWRVEWSGVTCALRVFRPEQRRTAQREIAAMRVASTGGIPVPEVYAEGIWRDRPALLLSWIPGNTLRHELLSRPWLAWNLAYMCGKFQAEIHRIAAPEALRDGTRDWIALAGPEEHDLQARLRELPLRTDVLLHLDYHPLNLMIEHRRVSGVLDWANTAAGEPRADLARSLAILRLTPPGQGEPRIVSTTFRRILCHRWQRGYESVTGPLHQMAIFHAWAAANLIADLAPKIGRPGIPLRDSDLDPARRAVEIWKRRAGITPG